MTKFKPYVIEQLGWYVYALRDPRNKQIFYIGKGMGNRVFAHAKAANTEKFTPSEKIETIRSIISAKEKVGAFIVQHGIPTEIQAYAIECALLDFTTFVLPKTTLKNLVAGHHAGKFGLMSTEAVMSLYDPPKAPRIAEPTLLIRIPQLWTPRMVDEDLYEATHGWWIVGPRREKANYAFSVNRGVIRGVYRINTKNNTDGRINGWREWRKGDRGYDPDKKPRWGFDGVHAPEMSEFLNTSVRHLFKAGEANPVKYINC
jgi:hypothetical protein